MRKQLMGQVVNWITIVSFVGALVSGFLAYLDGQPAWFVFIAAIATLGIIALVGTLLAILGPTAYRKFVPARKVRRQRLYLYTHPRGALGRKEYMAAWSPTEYFSTFFTSHVSWPVLTDAPEEKSITLYLLNPGPAAARHIKLTWRLEGVNISELVEETGYFGDAANRVSEDRIRLLSQSGWSGFPVATQIQNVPIPLLDVGESLQVTPPEAFTHAYTVYALCEAAKLSEVAAPDPIEVGGLNVPAYADYLEATHIRLKDVAIEIEYVSDAGPHRDLFHLLAWMRPLNAVRKQRPDEKGTYQLSEGAKGAWIDHVEVIPDETPRQPRAPFRLTAKGYGERRGS